MLRKTRVYRFLLAGFALLLPFAVVPGVCFVINQACFLWSLIALGVTVWRVWNTSRTRASVEMSDKPISVRCASFRLAATMSAVEILGLLWLGTVWSLHGAGYVISSSSPADRALGWIQAHWFSTVLFWLLLFGTVCGLLRICRPVLQWHRVAVKSLADAVTHRQAKAPIVASSNKNLRKEGV